MDHHSSLHFDIDTSFCLHFFKADYGSETRMLICAYIAYISTIMTTFILTDYGSETGSSRSQRRPTKVKIIGRTSPASAFDVSEYVAATGNNLPRQMEHLSHLRLVFGFR